MNASIPSRAVRAALTFLLCGASTLPAASLQADKNKTLGGAGAPIIIEIFSSFDCPHCRDLHQQVIPAIVGDYVPRGKVLLIQHESPMRPSARQAAIYATASARIGRYQQVADALYKNQAVWTANGQIWEIVASVLSPDEQRKVKKLAKDPDVSAEVDRDRQYSENFPSLPAMIVTCAGKSTTIPGVPNLSFFRHYLDMLAP
jgi:protein-disulfide isomerase